MARTGRARGVDGFLECPPSRTSIVAGPNRNWQQDGCLVGGRGFGIDDRRCNLFLALSDDNPSTLGNNSFSYPVDISRALTTHVDYDVLRR